MKLTEHEERLLSCSANGMYLAANQIIDLANVGWIDIRRVDDAMPSIVVYTGAFSVTLHCDDVAGFLTAYMKYKEWRTDNRGEINETLTTIDQRLQHWK